MRRRGTHRATATVVAAALLAAAGVAATARLTGPASEEAAARGTPVAATGTGPAASIAPSTQAPWTYGWPVTPFFRQHPVRGFFGDPRIGMTPKGMRRSFHFGVDVSCPNGTPVYATVTGSVVRWSFRPETVGVVSDAGHVQLEYWHVAPAVRSGQHVVAYRTVVGRVVAPWAHVHLAEQRDGRYVNPLRPGGMGPFADATHPVIAHLRVERDGARANTGLTGAVDLVVESWDRTPVAVSAPWNDKPVTPALLRWRLWDATGSTATPWHTAVDVRLRLPSDDRYDSVFARWTRQNKARRAGRYRFVLVTGLGGAALRARPIVEVAASDVRGNTTVRRFALTASATTAAQRT